MHVLPQPAAGVLPLEFDPELIALVSRPGPRYSSYPTADRFSADFGYRDYLQAVAGLRTRASTKPLALYLHIPFCDTVCSNCTDGKVVSINRDKSGVYLSYLKREIEMQSRLFAGMNRVDQLHLGGGAPTYLSDAQMEDLMLHLRRSFQFAGDEQGEYVIEVNPRCVTPERITRLRRQGFNRISFSLGLGLGLQQDDLPVLTGLVAAARAASFRSVGVALTYDLPGQDADTLAHSLTHIIKAAPDRVALCDYADQQAPDLPGAATRLAMLGRCIDTLGPAGYVYMGMHHFAQAGDELAIAQVQGRLHRNFQGYSTHPDADLVSCGVSAISAVASTYSQNVNTLDAYYDLIDSNELPIERGIRLGMDDALRRTIIQMLMCQFELSIPCIEQAYPIDFAQYFSAELAQLGQLERDGLVLIEREWLSVTPRGRILIRNVCMVFDRYLSAGAGATGVLHARTI